MTKLQAVILDWAGTTVDFGSFAPTGVIMEVFARRRVPITIAEARAPMGKYKYDHLQIITEMPRVAEEWGATYGQSPTKADLDAMFADLIPLQIETIPNYADVIAGVPEAITAMRARGLKIGSCTGYTTAMMQPLLPLAQAQGYAPDALVCPDEVGHGRPAPFMCYENARRLGVYPMSAMVKIGDTIADIEEGHNAGMWTVGIAKTGNELGLTLAEIAEISADELHTRLKMIYDRFHEAGAHFVVDSVADVLPVLDAIEEKLANGDMP
ncbi:MAG: phosphonoacetaldehyde hydrolase [bacterium]|nr:phosphonoacetaldehyde hydrolase [bacterium]